jgi:hypothetical protein
MTPRGYDPGDDPALERILWEVEPAADEAEARRIAAGVPGSVVRRLPDGRLAVLWLECGPGRRGAETLDRALERAADMKGE